MADEKRWGELVTTGIVRGNFMYIGAVDPGRGKIKGGNYSATLIIKKTDTETLEAIKNAIKEVGEVDSLSELDKHPFINDYEDKGGRFKDGDDPELNEYNYEGYSGCFFFKCTSQEEPEAFLFTEDGDIQRLRDRAEIAREMYNGAYYRVTLLPHYYELSEGRKTRKCVTFFLSAIIKAHDGDKLKGGEDHEQRFRNIMSLDNPLAPKKAAPKKAKKAVVEEEPEEVLEEEEIEEAEEEVAPKKETKAPAKKRSRKSASVTSLLD